MLAMLASGNSAVRWSNGAATGAFGHFSHQLSSQFPEKMPKQNRNFTDTPVHTFMDLGTFPDCSLSSGLPNSTQPSSPLYSR